MQLLATFLGERRAFPQANGTRFVIGQAATEKEIPSGVNRRSFIVVGSADIGELKPGLDYLFEGDFGEHPRYGWQFKFRSFIKQKPHGRDGTIKWLSSAPRIGPITAKKLWEAFGPDCIEKLKTEPALCADRVSTLTVNSALEASDYLIANEAQEACTIELNQMFAAHKGLHKGIVKRCIEKWGLNAPEKIRQNPFVLLSLGGVGFPTAYRIWVELGHPADAVMAQVMCMQYLIDQGADTWRTIGSLTEQVAEFISAPCRMTEAVQLGQSKEALAAIDNPPLITSWRRAEQEAELLHDIQRLEESIPLWPAVDNLDGLSEHQRYEARKALSKSIGILVGSPGTGKTHTLARLVKAIVNQYGPNSCCVLSFTNKAALRAREMLKEAGVKARSSTMHSALEPNPGSGGYDGTGWDFDRGRDNKLGYRFYILEEASMNGTEIMASLFAAIPDNANVLLVADENQLPPVGHGAVLRDLLKCGRFGTGMLREIHRSDGLIEQACADIRDHGTFTFCTKPDRANGKNLMHVECAPGASQIIALTQFMNWVKRDGGNPIKDAQIISSVNEKTQVSRKKINVEMQQLLNPSTPHPSGFRLDDKVIHRKKTLAYAERLPSGRAMADSLVIVSNGQQGTIVGFPDETTMAIETAGKLIYSTTKASINKFELAYAITAHASQGSQWPYVAVMVDESYGGMQVMSREWWTTAVSRAQLFGCTIGRWDVIEQCLRKQELPKRITRLCDGLCDNALHGAH